MGPVEPAPALACAALALCLVLEVVIPSRTALPAGSDLAPRRLRPPVAASIGDYPAILARPLFTPDRRMSEAASAEGGDGAGGALVVVGIAVGRGYGSAVLRAGDGRARAVRLGQAVDGWRLVSIDRTHVVLEANGQRRTLAFDPDAPPAGPSGQADAPSPESGQ